VNLLETARIALRGLRANRLRSALTTLGIVIGVASVIILVALGNGIQAGVNDIFGPLATQITVNPTPGSSPSGGPSRDLTDADVETLDDRGRAPDIESVTPVVTGTGLLQVDAGTQYRGSIVGSTADYLRVNDRDLVVGRNFDESEVRTKSRVVVLGPNAVDELFAGNAAGAMGQRVRIGRTEFRIIGVVDGNGQQDNIALMPLGAARSYLLGGGDDLDNVIVRATSTATVNAAVGQIEQILDDRHDIREPAERDFNVTALQSLLDQSNQILSFITLFTSAVAGISLIVGSIGVANIMLVTVTERTREIGIRKAIGARRRVILQQFLLESVFLTGLGGLVGILIGLGLSLAANYVLPQISPDFPPPVVSVSSVVIAFSVSLLIGLVAGGYPANRAAGLRPIEALRYQ